MQDGRYVPYILWRSPNGHGYVSDKWCAQEVCENKETAQQLVAKRTANGIYPQTGYGALAAEVISIQESQRRRRVQSEAWLAEANARASARAAMGVL